MLSAALSRTSSRKSSPTAASTTQGWWSGRSTSRSHLLATAAFVALGLTLTSSLAAADGEPKRIAVIGGGIGGASTAYHLRQLVPENTEITVYEASDRVGGRMQHATVGGAKVEVGASIFLELNTYMTGFCDKLGIKYVEAMDGHCGLWGGKEKGVVFASSEWAIVDMWRGGWRYGMSALYADNAINALVEKYVASYAPIANGSATFPTIESFVDYLDAADILAVDLETYLTSPEIGVVEPYIGEIASAINMNNYGQVSEELNGFAGLVSLVGGHPPLYTTAEGNSHVVTGLFDSANVELKLNTRVKSVTVGSAGEGVTVTAADGTTAAYDAVVLATPLELSGGLALEGLSQEVERDRPWKKTFVTLVVGEVNKSYFNGGRENLGVFLSIAHKGTEFRSLQRVAVTADGRDVHKIFSDAPVEAELLGRVFTSYDPAQTQAYELDAYPELKPRKGGPPFVLSDGALYYVNAMESVVSTMETQAVAGHNVANLVAAQVFGIVGGGGADGAGEGASSGSEKEL